MASSSDREQAAVDVGKALRRTAEKKGSDTVANVREGIERSVAKGTPRAVLDGYGT